MTANDVLHNWIQDAREGRIKDGEHELNEGERALVESVLQAIAADLLMLEEEGRE